MLAEGEQILFANIELVDEDLSALDVVETHHQAEIVVLPAPVWPTNAAV